MKKTVYEILNLNKQFSVNEIDILKQTRNEYIINEDGTVKFYTGIFGADWVSDVSIGDVYLTVKSKLGKVLISGKAENIKWTDRETANYN